MILIFSNSHAIWLGNAGNSALRPPDAAEMTQTIVFSNLNAICREPVCQPGDLLDGVAEGGVETPGRAWPIFALGHPTRPCHN